MKNRILASILVLTACQPPAAEPDFTTSDLPGSDFEGAAFEFELVTEDIYQARGTGNLSVGSNAAIIINEEDVLLVDSHISPVAAAALIDELGSITDKPVKYVVNTHFHFDHAHGNQIYPQDIEVIGHEFTREMLTNQGSIGRTYTNFKEILAEQPGFLEGQEGLIPTPPNVTLSERMALFRGEREIQLLFFGRGHTGGDIVVHLPQERILITGDLLLPRIPYIGDGFPSDWVNTLEELKTLDFDIIVPGHGAPFSDLAKIDHLQSYLTDLWDRTSDAYSQGLTAEQAAERIDLTDHSSDYPSLSAPGAPLPAVQRIYELLANQE